MVASSEAMQNFEALSKNRYTGRGIAVGRTVAGDLTQVYWVTGRSEPSRNRVIVVKDGTARTDVFDKTKVDKAKLPLLIYTAMASSGNSHIVSNGEQTDDIVRGVAYKESFEDVLNDWKHEPDAERTPRISGLTRADDRMQYKLSVITKHPDQERLDDPSLEEADRRTYVGTMQHFEGVGLAIHTYEHDAPQGERVPSFQRSPYAVPLGEDIDHTLEMYWGALDNPADDTNRVAVVVKTIDPTTGEIDFRHRNQLG